MLSKASIIELIKNDCAKQVHRHRVDSIKISSLIPEEIRNLLSEHIRKISRELTSVMRYMKVKTISERDVYSILQNIPVPNKIMKQCKDGDDKKCFHFPKAAFKKFFHNIARDYMAEIRYSEKALNLVQFVCEEHIKHICIKAIKQSLLANRVTLIPKDLQYALLYENDCVKHSLHKSEASFVDYTRYIKKVMKQIHSNVTISQDVKEQINAIVNLLGQAVVKQANQLLLSSKKSTIDERVVMTSVELLMKGELSKHAVSAAKRTIERFEKEEKKRVESKCNLLFSVSRTKEMMRSYTKNRLSAHSSIALTAVLEYITAELCELTGVATLSENKKVVMSRHLDNAIRNDEEIEPFIRSLGVVIM